MPGKTTLAGLGHQHQQARKRALAALRDGDPCPRCGRPMYRAMSRMLDLDDFPGRRYGGPQVKLLAHRHCNRSAGAKAGNRMRRRSRASPYTRW